MISYYLPIESKRNRKILIYYIEERKEEKTVRDLVVYGMERGSEFDRMISCIIFLSTRK